MTYLEIVSDRDFLEHVICEKTCNLCATDCRYECRYIREAKVKLREILKVKSFILFAVPIED